MIGVYLHFQHFFKAYISSKHQPYYYYFWAAQPLIVVLLLIFLPAYLSTRQHNIVIVSYLYLLSIIIDFFAAFIVCILLVCSKLQGGLLPVPLSAWSPYLLCPCFPCCINIIHNNKCLHHPLSGLSGFIFKRANNERSHLDDNETGCCFKIYQFIMNLIAHTLTFFLVSYVVQSLPNVLIAYYAYPTRALIRLSFIQISLVCLLICIATLIYLLEKLGWQSYVHYRRKAPKETEEFKSVKAVEDQSNSRIITTTESQSEDAVVVNLDSEGNKDDVDIVLKRPYFSICTTVLQILALFIILGALSIVLVLIGTIVFKQTEDNDTLKGLLTIIPTILGDVIIYITKEKLFHPKDLKIELKKD